MAKYWSEAEMFTMPQVAAVVKINEAVPFAILARAEVIRDKNPVASIDPPKTMAERISQMVFSIPAIPLDESSDEMVSLGVEMVTSYDMLCMTAL